MIPMDLTMPDMDVLEAIRVIAKTCPGYESACLNDASCRRPDPRCNSLRSARIRCGIRRRSELLAAIAQIREGGTAFSSQITVIRLLATGDLIKR
jgi:DNA-binding NarL/FixJ family response regulator